MPKEKLFRKKLNVKLPIMIFLIIGSIIINIISINKGTYGVLSTIYLTNSVSGGIGELNHILSLGLKGSVFLLAWQYFKYNKNFKLFIFSFCVFFLFQLMAGYKSGVIQVFLILFVANYLAKNKFNKTLFLFSHLPPITSIIFPSLYTLTNSQLFEHPLH